jgi:hypothetical protein
MAGSVLTKIPFKVRKLTNIEYDLLGGALDPSNARIEYICCDITAYLRDCVTTFGFIPIIVIWLYNPLLKKPLSFDHLPGKITYIKGSPMYKKLMSLWGENDE